MALNRIYTPVLHFDDINGRPLVGGKLYTYKAGTSTPEPTYRNSAGTELNENPILLNERGECVVWLNDKKSYKFVLKDAQDNTIWEADSVTIPSGEGGGPSPSGDELWGHWKSDDGWKSVNSSWTTFNSYEFAEGAIGGNVIGETGPIHLKEGLYDFKSEVTFASGGEGGYQRYDVRLSYGNKTLREMSFCFNDISTFEYMTEWFGGVFRMEDEGDVKFEIKRMTGTTNRALKISHFFVHSID